MPVTMDWSLNETITHEPRLKPKAIGVRDKGTPNASPLVFINLSTNPTVESREARHKHVISRWAVANACRYPRRIDEFMASDTSGTSTPFSACDNDAESHKRTGRKSRKSNLRWKHSYIASYSSALTTPTAADLALGAASKDPFESLPIKLDNPTWRLLNYWLEARGWDAAHEAYRNQVSTIRKRLCFPLLASSSVSLCAAIALIDLTVHPLGPPSATHTHLSRALPELHKALSNPTASAAPHAALAVVLLMNVAVRIRDFDALKAHFTGLAALLSQRPELHTRDLYSRGLLNAWAFSSARALVPTPLPNFVLFDERTCSVKPNPRCGLGLSELHRKGLLSDQVYFGIPKVAKLGPLLDLAVQNQLSPQHAADMLRCIWTSSLQLGGVLSACTKRVEKCCWYAITLHVLTAIHHDTDETLIGLANGVFAQLKRMDLDRILKDAPEMALWFSLTAASLTLDHPNMAWLWQVARMACDKLDIHNYGEASAVCETFVWNRHADERARQFYYSDYSQDLTVDLKKVKVGTPVSQSLSAENAKKVTTDPQLACPLCLQESCPSKMTKRDQGSVIESVKNRLGIVWSMNVSDFRKMCDQNWFDDEVDDPPDHRGSVGDSSV